MPIGFLILLLDALGMSWAWCSQSHYVPKYGLPIYAIPYSARWDFFILRLQSAVQESCHIYDNFLPSIHFTVELWLVRCQTTEVNLLAFSSSFTWSYIIAIFAYLWGLFLILSFKPSIELILAITYHFRVLFPSLPYSFTASYSYFYLQYILLSLKVL